MPVGMPEFVAKGPILARLDTLLSDVANRQNVLKDLLNLAEADAAGLAHLGNTYGVLTSYEETHFRDDWCEYWWSDAQAVAPIVRLGVITAIKVASGAADAPRAGMSQIPIDTYWICHPIYPAGTPVPETGDDGIVEVGVLWSAAQVTLIFYTPAPPGPSGPDTNSEPIEVVKHGANTDSAIVVRP